MAFRVFRGGGNEAPGNGNSTPAADDQIGPVLDRLGALATALEALEQHEHAKTGVTDTLARMERRDLQAVSAIDTFATALKSVSHHLAHLRQSVHTANGQHSDRLEAIAVRLSDIEERLANGLTDGLEFDITPLVAALDGIGQRLTNLETKLDSLTVQQSHWPFDADAFATALATIADRLARVESKVDSVAQQPALEPETTGNLLADIAHRVATVETKVDSGADGTSIAACLLAVDRRLSRIESGLGMDLPLPTKEEIPDLADVVTPEPLDTGFEDTAQPVTTAEPGSSTASDEAMPRERVDQLLQQVFRVLAR